ncbi:MAG: hypothetical protein AAF938_06430 [Myxococcota bacterium]
MTLRAIGFGAALLVCAGCGDDDAPADVGVGDVAAEMADVSVGDADAAPVDERVVGEAVARFTLSGETTERGQFYDHPWPSDLRLQEDGRPDLRGYPERDDVPLVSTLLAISDERPGYPTIPVASFRFSEALAPRDPAAIIPADADAPILLIDVDADSPERGRLFPTVAIAHIADQYTGENLFSVAPRMGFVLHPDRTYAVVIRRAFGDARGEPLGVPEALAQLAAGETPEGASGAEAAALYAPLFETLGTLGVAAADVAAATVFTTGDVVAQTRDLSDRVIAAETVTIDNVRLDSDGTTHERYCEYIAEVSFPQYQRGTPPFNEEGTFELGDDGLPIEQRRETALLHITIPKAPMPSDGYPLMMYFHGSGGLASQVVDRGPAPPGGAPAAGLGPADVVAREGIASVGASLPLSPDRLPGASAIEYINLQNLSAFRDTFRQGILEQRMLLNALLEFRLEDAMGCEGPTAEGAFFFDEDQLVALGQSMGGMYTNLIGAVEPRFQTLVPTGAGGHWSYFILETELIGSIRFLLSGALRANQEGLSFMHPALHLLALGWEAADPMVYMPRLSRRPLEGIPSRPIYQPAGEGDSFFPIQIYDAMALAYGHPQVGNDVWPSMQEALGLDGLEGIRTYPLANNLMSESGEPYTGAILQYAGDGFSDPHSIYVQLEDVRYQYRCFIKTSLEGDAQIVAPQAETMPCP